MAHAVTDTVAETLRAELGGLGDSGKRVLAQLRSQAGRAALAWWERPLDSGMSPVACATMVLGALFVDGWRVGGDRCPYASTVRGVRGGCASRERPDFAHATACVGQHTFGPTAVHTGMNRKMQQVLKEARATPFGNEVRTIWRTPARDLKMDTVAYPGALSLTSNVGIRLKGIALDMTIRAPTAADYLSGTRINAATTDGYAADRGALDKHRHYDAHLNLAFWVMVPMSFEGFGRLGAEGARFILDLASHAANAAGGTEREVVRRRSYLAADFRRQLSCRLAFLQAQRVLAYVREAQLLGSLFRPVSALLQA